MSHTFHIYKSKRNLELRSYITRWIREFFWSQNFLEVETPIIVKYPGQEPNLSPMKIDVANERGQIFKGYLHTSPEYTMKKMLSSGFKNIFSICKTFRNEESFGGTHNPEFTMLEWYRSDCDMFDLMRDVEALFKFVIKRIKKLVIRNCKLGGNYQLPITNYQYSFRRVSMCDLWKKILDIDLGGYLTKEKMYELCVEKKYRVKKDESYEELFYRIFLNEIEPGLEKMGAVIVYHYPAAMAALSRLSTEDPRYAERFEVYVDGVEVANAFSELRDAKEQLRRLRNEQAERRRLGKEVYDIDMGFIEALESMPDSAGIALGVDRFVQILLGCKNIDDVLVLPMSKISNS